MSLKNYRRASLREKLEAKEAKTPKMETSKKVVIKSKTTKKNEKKKK